MLRKVIKLKVKLEENFVINVKRGVGCFLNKEFVI